MRMRRKRNLDERLSAVSDYIIERTILDLNMKTSVEKKDYIDYMQVFGNGNRVELEIGCGKGLFITELAKRNPNVNYIAIEMLSNVIVEACEKAKREGLTNLRFMILQSGVSAKLISCQSRCRRYISISHASSAKGI